MEIHVGRPESAPSQCPEGDGRQERAAAGKDAARPEPADGQPEREPSRPKDFSRLAAMVHTLRSRVGAAPHSQVRRTRNWPAQQRSFSASLATM